MKKVKLYIVTYNRESELNTTLASLFAGVTVEIDLSVVVHSNHSTCVINPEFMDRVEVKYNSLRPDNSTGHLSRNYNLMIIDAFKDINEPDCDILVHSHDDNTFAPNWIDLMLKYHEIYDFISDSQGCGWCSYLPEHIKKTGMWDERFCTIGYHEGDYFIRSLAYNKDKVSINDSNQGRSYNALPDRICFKQAGSHNSEAHELSFTNYSVTRHLWEMKYPTIKDVGWTAEVYENAPKPAIHNHIMYPYFEKHLPDLDEKYYPSIDAHGRPFL